MVSQRKSKQHKKEGHLKASAAKLSNKRLNRLAKQGKLKRILGKKKLKSIVDKRLHPHKNSTDTQDGKQNEIDADEIPLEEADYEYFATPGRDYSFLSELSRRSQEPRRKRPADGNVDEDIEASYEKRLLKRNCVANSSNVEVKTLLPIKCKTLGVIRRTIEVPKATAEDDQPDSENDETERSTPNDVPQMSDAGPRTPAEEYIHRQLQIAEGKEKIANLCTSIISSPDENVGKLKELRSYLDNVSSDIPLTVRKLAALSLMEVFRDIIPEYRIRVITLTEKHQKMKKETKKLIGFEEMLVNNYRHYLESLEALASGKEPVKKDRKKFIPKIETPLTVNKSLCPIAVRCLCELLTAHPHFNYRSNIIAVVVPFVIKRNRQLSDMVCDCICRLFSEDKAGDVTLEIVRLIGRVVKAKKFEVNPKILATFLSLKIKEVEKSEGDSKLQKMSREERFKRFSKRERKRQKQMAHLERELQEAAVEDNKKGRLRLNTEIINTIFLTYFRILKAGKRSALLPVVLEGVSKFAHLINLSFFDDLFMVMTNLVDSGELTYRESLHCINTAFTLLTGVGASLNIDAMRFYTHLYRTLFYLNAGRSSVDLPVAIQCLDVLIGRRRRQIPPPRVLAFAKRLSTLALQMNSNGALALLALLRNIMMEHSRCDALLETESYGSGEFMPELEEPDLCNAHNTSLFELHLLRKSFHPLVRKCCDAILKGRDSNYQLPSELSHSSPLELYDAFDPSTMNFKPEFKMSTSDKKSRNFVPVACRLPETFTSAVDVTLKTDKPVNQIDFFSDLNVVSSALKRPKIRMS